MYLVIITLLACLIIQNIIIQKYKNNTDSTSLLFNSKLFDFFNSKIINLCIRNKKTSQKDKDTYIATLIHDLKTPAFAQIRTLNLLLEGYFGELTDEQKEILKETLLSEKYMTEIVSDILNVYKYDCGEMKLKKQFFNIADTLNDVYKSLNPLAEERNQKININYHCSNLIYFGDKLQITRVMTNLISNAIKYGFPNSVINVNLSYNSKEIYFAVENKTVPIPKEKLSHIFEKFTGGMTHYNSASTGLGLYLSKKIIEIHNGKIFAKCTDDGLCTFGFKLKVKTLAKIQQNVDDSYPSVLQ